MQEKCLTDTPEWIQRRILHSLDFYSMLCARVVCRQWNEILLPLIGTRAILNIRMDKSPASKRFRRGKWNETLIAPYQEIRLIPKPKNAFWLGKSKSRRVSTLANFKSAKKFTLFENGSLLHFIHRYMTELSAVKYVQIREMRFISEEKCQLPRYLSIGHAFSMAVIKYKSWMRALENLCKVETLRIRLFDRTAALLYMHLFTFRANMLAHVELDFSKTYGLPFSRGQMNEILCTLCDMLECCHLTLKQLRLKFAIRVDNDLDFVKSDDEIEPFFEFLMCLRNPVWAKLNLQQLTLTFPTMNLGLSLCEVSLFPFLQRQRSTLKRVVFGRVLPNDGIHLFATRFPPPMLQKFEFYFYFTETSLTAQPISFLRGVELLVLDNPALDLPRLSALGRARRNGRSLNYCAHLKLIHSHHISSYIKPDIENLTESFRNVRILELLDTSLYGKMFVHFTNDDFNAILSNLHKLVSLKMSNATKITDEGLTEIPVEDIRYMSKAGVFYWPSPVTPPLAEAKELKYLDLRDLSADVSDASIFFAFKHIRKLEKISFHGSHNITNWGKLVLEAKFKRNPFFDVIFKSYDDDYVTFGNYSLPPADFP